MHPTAVPYNLLLPTYVAKLTCWVSKERWKFDYGACCYGIHLPQYLGVILLTRELSKFLEKNAMLADSCASESSLERLVLRTL